MELSITKDAIIDTGDPSVPYSTNALNGGYILETKTEEGQEVTKKVGDMSVQAVDYPNLQRSDLWIETLYAKYQSFTKSKT